MTTDPAALLAKHDAAIEKLEAGQALIFTKLDTIMTALSELRGSSGPAIRDVLSFVRDGATLFALVVAGILYLTNATAGRSVSDLEARMTRLETIIGMASARPRAAPGAWVPDTAWAR